MDEGAFARIEDLGVDAMARRLGRKASTHGSGWGIGKSLGQVSGRPPKRFRKWNMDGASSVARNRGRSDANGRRRDRQNGRPSQTVRLQHGGT